MRVEFNDVDEFLAELKHGGAVERVVRVTQSQQQNRQFPQLWHLSVVATHLVHRGGVMQLIKLTRYVGDFMAGPVPDTGSDKVRTRAEELIRRLEEGAKELGYECRAGIWVEDDPPKLKRGDPPVI